MCVGAGAVIGAVLSIAQAAVGFSEASRQADEQNAYYERNRAEAVRTMTDDYSNLQRRELQENEAQGQESFEKQIEAARTISTARTAAGEAGVTGLSVNALVQDLSAQRGRGTQAINRNYVMQVENLRSEMKNAENRAISRINSVRRASKPSAAPFILQGLGGALNAVASG